jgi:UDP-4-amino-4,6-dideoxy-N-acetyl-beta-L-altrosamine transaminase
MSDADRFLPYGRQTIDEEDIAAVANVLRGDWLTTGPMVGRFEAALAAETGAKHVVVCSNGTTALHLSAVALDLKEGDAVVVPAITFLATANAARYVGADVVFADVDPDTALMGPEHLTEALERAGKLKARAAFPVHLGGQSVDMAGLAKVARDRGLALVEDACHALGGRHRASSGDWATIGACADSAAAVFSFHPVKTIAMGEGGAVATNDPAIAERCRRLRSHGMVFGSGANANPDLARDGAGEMNPWYYEMPEIGFNYRATDIQCALGLSQLRHLGAWVRKRAALLDHYREALKPLAPIVKPLGTVPWSETAWHLAIVLIDFDAAAVSRATVMTRLREKKIGSQVHYIPLHWQPYFRKRYGNVSLPGAESYYRRCLSLPLYPSMETGDVDRVVAALKGALG